MIRLLYGLIYKNAPYISESIILQKLGLPYARLRTFRAY